MKNLTIIAITCLVFSALFFSGSAHAQKNDIDLIKTLDTQWEQALQSSDTEFITLLLAEDFVWIHNHASLIDTKKSLLERANTDSGATGNPKSRINKDVNVIVHGMTAVVTGFTIVDRGPSPKTYHFMRTYTKTDSTWILLANQTMAIPEQ